MAETTERITYQMEVSGQQAVVAAFEAEAKAIKNTDTALKAASATAHQAPAAFKQVAAAANDNAKAFDAVADKGRRLTPVLGALGNAVAGLSPELGALGQAFGRAGGAMAGMTAIIGGAGGIVAGGLVAGLGLLSVYMKTVKSDAEQMAEAIDLASSSMDRARRVDGGSAAARERRRRQGLLIAGNFTGGDDTFSKNNADNLAAIAAAENSGLVGDDIGGKGGKRADVEFDSLQRRNALDKQIANLDRMQNAPTLDQRIAGNSAVEKKKEENEEFARLNQERFDDILKTARETDKELEKIDEAQQKRYDATRDKGREVYDMIGRHAAHALSQIAVGQKVSIKATIAAIGQELVAKGVMWGFDGAALLAKTYGTDPAGWELLAQGGAATAAGFAMGAIGTYGSASGRSAPTRQITAADPYRSADTTGGRSSPTININMPTVVSPTAQDGQRVYQAMKEADRQGFGNAA